MGNTSLHVAAFEQNLSFAQQLRKQYDDKAENDVSWSNAQEAANADGNNPLHLLCLTKPPPVDSTLSEDEECELSEMVNILQGRGTLHFHFCICSYIINMIVDDKIVLTFP